VNKDRQITIDANLCSRAAQVIREGGIVAFPTETVYGLGANALDEAAVRRVFQVKGRPASHPLIVHLSDTSTLEQWTGPLPDAAIRLAERFWPGPLTLILPKSPKVPRVVTGGQDTVGLRVPNHPVALALLREFGGGIAAPSANRFGNVSPTTAEHVRRDLANDVDLILDGGPCAVGVESTIVSLIGEQPTIVRPGGVTREEIEALLGGPVPVAHASAVRAPGQFDSHYAPRAEVILVPSDELERCALKLREQGRQVRVLSMMEVLPKSLFASLRRADDEGVEIVLASLPNETGMGLAIADRLRKAAAPRVGKRSVESD